MRLPAKAPLSALLAQATAAGPAAGGEVERVGIDHADPRELVLKTARRLEAELQLIARLVGQLPEPPPQQTVNVLIASPEWMTTRAAILRALEPYPDARAAVVEAIQHAAVSN